MRSDIVPGGTFPDYELPDHTERPAGSASCRVTIPLILTLARGHYCPKEHQQHLQLARVLSADRGGVHADRHDRDRRPPQLQEFRASVGAQWTFLSDPGRTIQQDLDIQEYTDPEHDPMIPHTLVLEPGLVVHSIYNGYWFWGRPSVEDLRQRPAGRHRQDPSRLGPQHARGSARPGTPATTRRSTVGTSATEPADDRLTRRPITAAERPPPAEIAHAALTSPMWLKACGKLPRSSPLVGSTSSASRPTSLTNAGRPLEHGARPLGLAGRRQGLGQPEGAEEEDALLAVEPVAGAVAVDEPALVGEPFLGGGDGREHPRDHRPGGTRPAAA